MNSSLLSTVATSALLLATHTAAIRVEKIEPTTRKLTVRNIVAEFNSYSYDMDVTMMDVDEAGNPAPSDPYLWVSTTDGYSYISDPKYDFGGDADFTDMIPRGRLDIYTDLGAYIDFRVMDKDDEADYDQQMGIKRFRVEDLCGAYKN